MAITFTEKEFYQMVQNWIKFPFPKICKHTVALDLLNILEKKGCNINAEIVKSISDCEDGKTLELLEKYTKETENHTQISGLIV